VNKKSVTTYLKVEFEYILLLNEIITLTKIFNNITTLEVKARGIIDIDTVEKIILPNLETLIFDAEIDKWNNFDKCLSLKNLKLFKSCHFDETILKSLKF
jgi:hypothetical protein